MHRFDESVFMRDKSASQQENDTMNKNNRRFLSTAMAVILVMVVMCGVGSAAKSIEIEKVVNTTLSDSMPVSSTYTGVAYYDVYTGTGSHIVYDIILSRTKDPPITVEHVTDEFPMNSGIKVVLTPPPPSYVLDKDGVDAKYYTSDHTIDATDVSGIVAGGSITITDLAEASGYEGNPPNDVFAYGGAACPITVNKIDTTPPPPTPTPPPPVTTEVPAYTPPGIAALIGLLGLIGAGIIMRRR